MKKITIGAVTALALTTLAILPLWQMDAEAESAGNGCKLQGTWIGELPYPLPGGSGFYSLKFFATFNGTGDTDGTEVTEWVNPVPDPGTSWSNTRGVWVKSGPNTYQTSKVGFLYLVGDGTVLTIIRHASTGALKDCNTMEVTGTAEYLDAGTMQPQMCVPYTATLKRVLMHTPCQVPN